MHARQQHFSAAGGSENSPNLSNLQHSYDKAPKKKKTVWRAVKKTVRKSLSSKQKRNSGSGRAHSDFRSASAESFCVDDLIEQQNAEMARFGRVEKKRNSITQRAYDAKEQPDTFAVTSSMASQSAAAPRSRKIRFWRKKNRAHRYATSADLETLIDETGETNSLPNCSHFVNSQSSTSMDHHAPTQCSSTPVSVAGNATKNVSQNGSNAIQRPRIRNHTTQQSQHTMAAGPANSSMQCDHDDNIDVQEILRLSQEKAQIMEEEVKRFQKEKLNSSKMQIDRAKKRIQELLQVNELRNDIWKNAPNGSYETKCAFWGDKKLGFKVKLRDSYPHVVDVSQGDQAHEKGMRVGDVIIGINNNVLAKQPSYAAFVGLLHSAKRPFVVNVLRPAIEQTRAANGDQFFSARCNLTGNVDLGFELADENYEQYVVGKVDTGSLVQRQGVQAGDILMGMNGTPFPKALPVGDVMNVIYNHPDSRFELDFCREQQPQSGIGVITPNATNIQPRSLLKNTPRCGGSRPHSKSVRFSTE